MIKLARTIGLLLVLNTPIAAQDTPFIVPSGGRPLLRLDGTYVFQHMPHSDLVFEGQIAPRIIVFDSIGKATRNVLLDDKIPAWGYQVSTTPMVRLRMFDEASNPVRTPSYMPKGTFQLTRFRNISESTDSDSDEFNAGPIEMWMLDAIPFGHHSNGQDGCLFISQSRDANGECVKLGPTSPRAVNKKDGSFSTNYIEAIVHYGRMYLDSEGAEAGEFATRWEWRAGAGLQLNPEGYIGGAIKPQLADLYGPTRVLVAAMTARRDAWRCGRASGELRLQVITEAPIGLSSLITQAEGACFPANWSGAGLFLRIYHGQDYYNLGFAEEITRLQFGVTLQRDQFLSFRVKPI
jgi:hypothetical protein